MNLFRSYFMFFFSEHENILKKYKMKFLFFFCNYPSYLYERPPFPCFLFASLVKVPLIHCDIILNIVFLDTLFNFFGPMHQNAPSLLLIKKYSFKRRPGKYSLRIFLKHLKRSSLIIFLQRSSVNLLYIQILT